MLSPIRRSIIIADMKTYDREQVIELLRKRRGLTPVERFAAQIGVKPVYLSQILAGYRNPGKRVLKFLDLGKEKTVTVVYFELNGGKR